MSSKDIPPANTSPDSPLIRIDPSITIESNKQLQADRAAELKKIRIERILNSSLQPTHLLPHLQDDKTFDNFIALVKRNI